MKTLFVAAICLALPAAAVAPEMVWIDVAVSFDPSAGTRGTFSASGAVDDTGTVADSA